MGLIANNNIPGVHFPCWEQLPSFMPANSAAGSCACSDGKRYIYYLISSSSFWRIDTWTGVCEPLPNPGSGSVGAGTCMCYARGLDYNSNLNESGSLFVLLANGTTTVFYQYFITSRTWALLSSTNLPSNFGTDGSLFYPEPYYFNNSNHYDPNIITEVTILENITSSSYEVQIQPTTRNIPAYTLLNFGTNEEPKYFNLLENIVAGNNTMIGTPYSEVPINSKAYYYDFIYLIGNNSTQIYRYQISNNSWNLTFPRDNATNMVLPSAAGAGCYLTGFAKNDINPYYNNALIVVRGNNTNNIFVIYLDSAYLQSLTSIKLTETFATGSQYATKKIDNENNKLIAASNITKKYNYIDIENFIKFPIAFQDLFAEGTAIVGNRTCIINQNGIDYLYTILNTSNVMLRCPILW